MTNPSLERLIAKWEDEVCRTQITTDKGKQRVRELRVLIAAAKAQDVLDILRKKIHFTERHNRIFARCESAWCHPSRDCDPACGEGEDSNALCAALKEMSDAE